MAELKSLKSLVNEAFYLIFCQRFRPVFHNFIDIVVHEVKDKVQVIVDPNNFFELDNVLMIKFPESLDLS